MRACTLACAALTLASAGALAQTGQRGKAVEAQAESAEAEKQSPWLAVPIFSVSPKLGTSLGAMVGYLHYFDEKSRVSMIGVTAQYTSTDSAVGGLFGRLSFGEDHHRVVAMAVAGTIKNDYSDYLGTGVPLRTDDELSAVVSRYLYRVTGDWFFGVQGAYTNYYMAGQSAFDEQVLNLLGMQGFKSAGIGLAAYHDSRDDENMPTRGWLLNVNNIAYRDELGGDDSFDVYRLDYRLFWSHRGGILAARQFNQWTVDAPAGALAPVQLRGYKMGQYLGKRMSSIEVEERLRLAEKWTATLFLGVACLYGGSQECTESENTFPNGGFGVQYILKQKEGIVVNLEYAAGKGDNYGVYMKMGYSF
jgi:hypothetical protein